MRWAVCHVMGAGEFFLDSLPIEPGDMLIAADGGMGYLDRMGLTPDLLVGDFDSLEAAESGVPTIALPAEKDVTDAMAALDEGLARGFRRFALYGGVGGRFDHTLANVQAMAYLAGRGARGVLIGDGDALTAVRDGAIEFPAGLTGYLSVFCHGDRATGVNERGLKYSLTDATLTNRHALGVSNEFTGAPARVSVASGTLVIYWHQAAEAAVALLAAQP
ncbi:MAG: thiamine diphosphokinase [Clostridiales bacterium]|nr:thiamine diphosphokinase [Clostridiales bacterium]